jgi:hypothetical protein
MTGIALWILYFVLASFLALIGCSLLLAVTNAIAEVGP